MTSMPSDTHDHRTLVEDEAPQPPHDPDAVCWCCGGPTVKRHCKIICTNCGFMRDCSDP